VDSRAEQRLIVEGNLAEPCVSELESFWQQARQACRRGKILIDLSGVTVIDPSGEAALTAMIAEGARLTSKGVYNKHLIKELIGRAREVYALNAGSKRNQ
jgi:ABC-type transporter Mla MlaB component